MAVDFKKIFKGGYFWLEKVAILIGVMGGLKGASDLWEARFPHYDLEITRSAPLTLTYDPRQKVLTCSVGLIFNNRGSRSDEVELCSGDLRSTTDRSRHYAFSDLYVVFKDSNNEVPKNLPTGVVVEKTNGTIAVDVTPCENQKEVVTFVKPYTEQQINDVTCGKDTYQQSQVIQQ
jgi:hypothetical protein